MVVRKPARRRYAGGSANKLGPTKRRLKPRTGRRRRMNTKQVIEAATRHLKTLPGHVFDVLSVAKPVSPTAASNLAKVISKLSPLVGNMIEFNLCEFLNDQTDFAGLGQWRRQDPGFPDVIFDGQIAPTPGFEVKAWFPLATEITARFKDSQTHFTDDKTYVLVIAWLPEFLIFGRPKILDLVVASGISVAHARDTHYHNPPDYLVLEPEDTSNRTRNLQQTNTSGYKWQPSDDFKVEAKRKKDASEVVTSWGKGGTSYSPTSEYQAKLEGLRGRFKYRQDTNYAKIDRIGHVDIETFADKVYAMDYHGRTVGDWNAILASRNDARIRLTLEQAFEIRDQSQRLVK